MEQKKIALVSITINAVNPMTDYLKKNVPEFKVVNYLDGYLMEKIRAEGGVNEDSMDRMLRMIANAVKDGNDGIIITCTVFSKYQPAFSELFPIPIVSADTAMLTETASHDGKTAIIYTFPGTYNTTLNGYKNACAKIGKEPVVDMVLAEGAFEAAQAGHLEESDRIVREKIMELDEHYDIISLAQISLIGALQGLELKHAQVFSSPSCAAAQMKKVFGNG